jgi:ferredoxin-NADP reductase/predicted pyridoxine 5'-phosphate oxidase superfamily flavin-nucleotide-binding protein
MEHPDMDMETRLFIENATLLFIASRNREGEMDVSPRGGQPCVLRVTEQSTLLLPDYSGNRRLDTIGNLLSNPSVALIVLNRGSNRYLRITASVEVSFQAEDLACFPADENPPISVLILTPETVEFVDTAAFARADFWLDPDRRKPPLDLGAVVGRDKQAQAAAGFGPVLKNAEEERLLANAGVRNVYGTPSEGVQKKVCDITGPGGLDFIDKATFIVVAHEGENGEIAIDLTAEAPLSVIPFDNRHAYRLRLPPEVTTGEEGECALLTVTPGRNELLRINGRFEEETRAVKIVPREVFFHCSAAFSRSRVWQRDRRSYWSGKRRFVCVERHRESPDVASFVLRPRDNAPIGPVEPGQYITVSLPDGTGAMRQRSYSVSRRPDGQSLRITVRRIGAGGISDLLHEKVEPGTELLVGVPAGRFVLSSPPGRPIVLVSAGVGITPLLPMLEHLAREDDGREVWFIHAARDGGHHLFAEEAQSIVGRANDDRIHLVSCYSRPRHGDECDLAGRIDAAALVGLVPVRDVDFYICGPEAFMTSLSDGLVALGASPDSIRFEAFAAAEGGLLDLSGTQILSDSKVTFAKSGKTAIWTPLEGSLLDLALQNSVDVAYSCRVGDCQSCVQRIVSGIADYPAGEVPLLAYDQVLLCQAVPRGDVVLEC